MRIKFPYGTTAENDGLLLPEGMLSVDLEKKAIRLHDGATQGGFEVVGEAAINFPMGPGPQALVGGDWSAGFFGEVTSTELISGDALAAAVDLTAGTPQHSDHGWLKFAHGLKLLYVSKRTLRAPISWNQINEIDLIYGDRVIEINGLFYKVRLLTGGDGDPSSASGGEWNDLLYNVHTVGPDTQGWAQYGNSDLIMGSGRGSSSWCQETDENNSIHRIIRGAPVHGYVSASATTVSTGNYGWRPCLELVD